MRNMTVIYANGRNGKYAAIEIDDNVATMERERGVSERQAIKALEQETGKKWETWSGDNYFVTFKAS